MKKIIWLCSVISVIVSVLMLVGCSGSKGNNNPNLVRVGTIAGPETKLMEVAKQVALKKFGLDVHIVAFSSYTMPNQALEDGAIDANAFQHKPYLLSQVKMHGYTFAIAGKTFLYPMGLYSKSVAKLADLKPGAEIAIPNDPSNEARALLLLQGAGLIQLKPGVGINATIRDVTVNPKKFKLISLDAAQIPRALDDVALAAINTNYAIPFGLSPAKNALYAENTDSPYVNLIVVRSKDKNQKKIKELVEAFQSQAVVDEAKKLFGDGAVPGFQVS